MLENFQACLNKITTIPTFSLCRLKSLGLVISFIYFVMIRPNRKSSEIKPPLMAFNIKPAYYVVCIVCNNFWYSAIQYNAF